MIYYTGDIHGQKYEIRRNEMNENLVTMTVELDQEVYD